MMKTTNLTHPILALLVLMLLMFAAPLVQAAPGGVSSNLQLWLKADVGISQTDGQTLTNWVDQSTNAYTASNTAGNGQTSPTFRNNTTDNINFNPAVEFDGANNGVDLAGNYIYSNNDGMTFFAAIKSDVKSGNAYIFDFGWAANYGYGFSYNSTSHMMYTSTNSGGAVPGQPHSYTTNAVIYTGKIDFGTEQRAYLNGTSTFNANITLAQLTTSEITENPNHASNQGPVTIGRISKADSCCVFDGKIAEVILYDADLVDADRNKVQSYLALKYGTTLDSSIDYLASSGTTIYPSTSTHSGYINDIAGIGTDNGSVLNQPKSRSVNSDSIITVTGSGIADANFLIWGNDDGALTFSSTEVPGSGKRLTREWKVAETGDVGSVTLSFDLTSVAGADLSDATKFILLTDADGNFSDATETTGATINSNSVKFSGVNLSNGQYFSLAYNNVPIAGFGTALDFDGTDDQVLANLATTATDNVTMEAWVNWSGGTGSSHVIFNNGDGSSSGYGLLLGAGDSYDLKLLCGGVGSSDSNTNLPIGEWHHVALVRNSGTWEFYLDGITIALSSNLIPNTPSGIMSIGSNNLGTANFFGQIDEIRVWNTARTEAEIQASSCKALSGTESGLVDYWQFEEGSGTTTNDISGTGNDGTLTNMDNADWTTFLTFTTNENTPLNGVLFGCDPDGNSLTYTIVNNDGGAAVITNSSNGAFTYTPTTSGTRTFTYKVNDGVDDSNIATVTVTVTSLVVSNIGDTDDGNYALGQNTLREAITNASAGDTITFDSSIAGQTITLSSELTIDKNLTINGTGQKITISGGGAVRVFNVTANTVTFNKLTIANGNSTSGDGFGGGIKFSGSLLTIEGSSIVGNTAFWGGVFF